MINKINIPRGIRNNNPGNIRWGDDWQGLDPQGREKDPAFCVFTAPEWEIRALVKILCNYQTKYKLRDVRSILNRYAPPNENDTESYIANVCRVLGVRDSESVNVFEKPVMLNLIKAIIRQENGEQPYSNEILLKGIKLAGM